MRIRVCVSHLSFKYMLPCQATIQGLGRTGEANEELLLSYGTISPSLQAQSGSSFLIWYVYPLVRAQLDMLEAVHSVIDILLFLYPIVP